MDLKVLLDEFITSLKVRGFAETTLKEVFRKLCRFLDYLFLNDITSVDQITQEVISEYQAELYHRLNSFGKNNSVAYQNLVLCAVKKFMAYLKEQNYIVTDPTCHVQYAREPKRLPRSILTRSEARKIINAPDDKSITGYRDKTMLEVLYSTGIRKTELYNLTLEDVDYKDGFLRIINGKGGKDRVVPVGKIACRYLENYIRSVRPELIRNPYENHLFLSMKGRRLSRCMLGYLVRRYAQKAKIKKNVTPHTFRHTCATGMLKNKADIRSIQALLGHSSLESTQVYTHVSINDLKAVHQKCHPREKDRV